MAETSDQLILDQVTRPAFSMFVATPLYVVDGLPQYGLRRIPVFPDPTDQVFMMTFQAQFRLDLVSYAFYQTCELAWVIADVNNVSDMLMGVLVGSTLRVPLKSRLTALGLLNS